MVGPQISLDVSEPSMPHDNPESDWKLFRKLSEIALERFCEKTLREAAGFISDTTGTSHERYLKLYRYINKRDEDLGRAFNDPKRSAMVMQLAVICKYNLLTSVELARFTSQTQEKVESMKTVLE